MKVIKRFGVGALLAAGAIAMVPAAAGPAHADPCGGYYVGQWGGNAQCGSERPPGYPIWKDISAPFFQYHGWACGATLYVDPNQPCP